MTEPVARAVSPRRTVRVAVALVAGQAALCAVIGWVTFGPSESAPRASGTQTLAKPDPVPTPTIPQLGAAPVPPAASATRAPLSPRASRSSRPPATRPTSKPAGEKPQPVIAPGPTTTAAPKPPDMALTPPPPSPVGGTQSPAVEDRPCDPEGAEGRTSDGVELRCVREADGDLVWQII